MAHVLDVKTFPWLGDDHCGSIKVGFARARCVWGYFVSIVHPDTRVDPQINSLDVDAYGCTCKALCGCVCACVHLGLFNTFVRRGCNVLTSYTCGGIRAGGFVRGQSSIDASVHIATRVYYCALLGVHVYGVAPVQVYTCVNVHVCRHPHV